MKSYIHLLLVAFTTVTFEGGCNGTYQTTKRSELRELSGKGPIRVLTVDSLLYTFERFSFSESELTGHGTLKHEGAIGAFEETIPFSRIVFIERLEPSFWKGAWVIPMAAGIVSGLSAFAEPSKFEIRRPSGGSCPSLYAFDGKEFKLEGEAFSTSISKSLEAKTFTLLPSLAAANGQLIVRVSNERPETHLINSVHLLAGDAQEASATVLDIKDTLWPVVCATPPINAVDHSGRDALSAIARNDGHYWKSDLAHTAPFSGFRDYIEAAFAIPVGTSEATLVIDAINTDLITEVYRSVGQILGDATLEFYRALEQDSQLKNTVRNWIHESSLRIEIGTADGWKEIGSIVPEATMTSFSRAIRINGIYGLPSMLRVRLSTLTDGWRIDAVSVDFTPVNPIQLHPVEILSATSSDGMDLTDAVAETDSLYSLVLPPQHVEITFDPTPILQMRKAVYVLAVQGYLYEWFPAPPQATAPTFVVGRAREGDPVEMFKLIVQQKDVFLPPIYARWRQRANE